MVARKPEDFDTMAGDSTLSKLDGESGGQASLRFVDGRIGIDIADAPPFGELIVMPPETVEIWRDNLDAWIRWRGLKSRGRLEHRFCPVHGNRWQREELDNSGAGPVVKRYVCSEGDIWRAAGPMLLPWDEQV